MAKCCPGRPGAPEGDRLMPVLSRVEGRIVWNARNERAIQVTHRLGQVEAISHLVGNVVKLRSQSEPPKGFDPSVEGLHGAGRRCHNAVDSGCGFEEIGLEVAEVR